MSSGPTDTGRGELLWEPPAELVERARLTEYMRWLESKRGLRFQGYEELWRWSVDDLEAFWGSIWDFFGVQADGGFERVLGSRGMPGAGQRRPARSSPVAKGAWPRNARARSAVGASWRARASGVD